MKKAILSFFLIIIVVGLLCTTVFADSTTESKKEEIKFRDYEWGTSLSEILEKEITSSMIENEDYIIQDNQFAIANQNVAGYDCFIIYEFNEKEELIRGTYMLTEEHSNEQQYYKDFKDLANKLISVYGEPDTDNREIWYNDTYKDKPNKQGLAITVGDLEITYQWYDKQGNYLAYMIYGDNYRCSTALVYNSKESREAEDIVDTDGL